MNDLEIAKTKIERAIKLVENFEELNEEGLSTIILFLKNALEIIPTTRPEKYQLYSYLNLLDDSKIRKYGTIFKAHSPKESFILKKADMEELAWTIHSLLSN